jgi:hypothetical protein
MNRHASGRSALRQQEAALKPQRRGAEYHTGSIIIVPASAENCWQRMIDNRTGKMWDKVTSIVTKRYPPQDKDQRVGMSSLRMNAIGKAFNRGGDN